MKLSRLTVALALAGAVSAGGAAAYEFGTRAASPAPAAAAAAAAATPSLLPDFRSLAEQHGAAVVNISVTQAARGPLALADGGLQRGQGSGFIVSADGLVLTNAHVVDGAAKVTVKLTDRREFQAKVIGKDAKSDVAVLKIDARNLPVVKIGDPANLRPGEWVVAIGAPFGFENSVTAGIVSAKGRSLPDDTYVPFIQTDVAVNPGNSGGPLFNLAGEVVGINSQILSQTGGYQGLSFAIPIDIAMGVKDQIVRTGHVTRGYLGVTVQPLSGALADSFGLRSPQGALVSAVLPGTPAAKAGLKPGDVILSVDGRDISGAAALPSAIAAAQPGATVRLEVWRDKSKRAVTVAVDELKAEADRTETPAAVASNKLGLTVRHLSPQEQAMLGKPGLLVEESTGPAANAGVQAGDILLAVNGVPLTDAARLREAVAGPARHIALLVQRGDSQIFIPVARG